MDRSTVIKLGLFAGAALVLVYAARRASAAVSGVATGAWNAAADTAWALSPTNNENVIYQTVNRALGGTEQRPIGIMLYDFLHPPEPLNPPPPQIKPGQGSADPLVNEDGMDFRHF